MPVLTKGKIAPSWQELTANGEWCTADWIEDHAEEWRELCKEGPCDQPFFRPEWIAAYLRAFAPGQPILMITVRESGRLRAVLPLLKERSYAYALPFTKLRGAANVHSCRFDVIHGNEPDREAISRAIWGCLKNLPGWDMVELPDVPAGGAAEQLMVAAEDDGFFSCRCESMRSLYRDLRGQIPHSDYSRFALKSHFRYSVRRRRRRLEENGPLSLRSVREANPSCLQRFYDLERSGWKGKKRSAIACSKEVHQFYDSIAKSADVDGYLSLYFLELGNSTLAAHFGLTYRHRYYPLKIAYDEAYSKCAPGHLLVGAILEDCVRQGVAEFDFLGQWADWKAEWASEVRPHAYCYIFRKGPLGRILRGIIQQRHNVWLNVRRVGHRLVLVKRCYASKIGNRHTTGSQVRRGRGIE